MYYAIAIVPATWEADFSLGFSASSYERWHEQIEPGTRILLYKESPVNAIIGEAIVQDNVFVPLEDLPAHNQHRLKTSDGNNADYALPLRVTYLYPHYHYVSREQLDEMMNAQNLNGWIPIDDEIYRALTEPSNLEATKKGV